MMTDRRTFLATGIAVLGAGLAGCAGSGTDRGWVTLVDGSRQSSIDGWTQLGEGNWSFVDGTLQGKNGNAGFLVSVYESFDTRKPALPFLPGSVPSTKLQLPSPTARCRARTATRASWCRRTRTPTSRS